MISLNEYLTNTSIDRECWDFEVEITDLPCDSEDVRLDRGCITKVEFELQNFEYIKDGFYPHQKAEYLKFEKVYQYSGSSPFALMFINLQREYDSDGSDDSDDSDDSDEELH